MRNYNLLPNESVLYTGCVSMEKHNGSVELTLTNLNIIIVYTTKKLLGKEKINVDFFPVEQVKIYNEKPQIKQKDLDVEIFLTTGEFTVGFETKAEAHKFVSSAVQLLTGKSAAVRGAEKVRGAIDIVDKALGINTVDTVKNVIESRISNPLKGGLGSSNANKSTGTVKTLLSGIATRTSTAENTAPTDEQLESLKKLKALADDGVLTQEEFEAKKKQILGL